MTIGIPDYDQVCYPKLPVMSLAILAGHGGSFSALLERAEAGKVMPETAV